MTELSEYPIDPSTAVLKAAHVDARLEGLLLRACTQQTFRNDTRRNLEIVHTFPMPWGATLLGLSATVGGRRLHGAVVERVEAEERYESAIEAGDTPVMVERAGDGLYGANLGNLLPGEEAVVEIHWAQLLRCEQGRVRIAIPTVIGERYGDPVGQGGLAAHLAPAHHGAAAYPFTLVLDLAGEVARACVTCHSHVASVRPMADGVRVELREGAWLDRDAVIELSALQVAAFTSIACDGAAHVALASFCPALAPKPPAPLRLKLLVDCSGSMAGDGIASARRGLHALLQALSPQDRVSFSRFGSRVEHHARRLARCTPSAVTALSAAVSATQADLGGTEMRAALESTITDVRCADLSGAAVDLLLITDGEVWDVDAIVALAEAAGHRIFAVGVGAAPAASLLWLLAERTGGACELVSPNEDVDAAIGRMLGRIRGPRVDTLQVDWGVAPAWQTPLPRQLFGDETLHVFAGFDAPPPSAPWLRVAAGGAVGEAWVAGAPRTVDPVLARLAAAHRVVDPAMAPAQALALALTHQLVTERTSLLLVHERPADAKALEPAALARVAQMAAAGQHGYGTARQDRFVASQASWSSVDSLSYSVSGDQAAVFGVPGSSAGRLAPDADRFEIPAFLRQPDHRFGQTDMHALLVALAKVAARASNLREAVQRLDPDLVPSSLSDLLLEILTAIEQELGHPALDFVDAWAVLIDLLGDHAIQGVRVDAALRSLARQAVAGLGADLRARLAEALRGRLPWLGASMPA